MSIFLRSGGRGLQRWSYLKYYYVLEWERGFTFTTECCQKYQLYKKMLQIKIVRIQFPIKKTQRAHMSITPRSGGKRL